LFFTNVNVTDLRPVAGHSTRRSARNTLFPYGSEKCRLLPTLPREVQAQACVIICAAGQGVRDSLGTWLVFLVELVWRV